MSVLEAIIVVGVTLAAALALVVLGWAILLRSRRELYIAPFHVAGDQTDPALGMALANMLRARLERLQRELASARQTLEEQPQSRNSLEVSADPTSILLPASITVPRGLLEPVEIDISIGNVAVGGLVAWLQEWALESRTLRFTVFYEGERAVVSGNIAAMPGSRVKDLWLETKTSAEVIVTRTAHALLQSHISRDAHGPIGALDPQEFEDLLSCLYELAEVNRRAVWGESRQEVASEATPIVERLVPLTARFPEWGPLLRLAANVADRAGRFDQAMELRSSAALASETSAGEDLEEAFLDAVRVFSKRVYPDDDPPNVAFDDQTPTAAFWNSDLGRYQVNPNLMGQPRLHGYVALMGRFMMKHYRHCFPDGAGAGVVDTDLWQDFRWSVVEYLLLTDPAWPGGYDQFVRGFRVGRALLAVDRHSDVTREGLRRLALDLLDRFSCEWTFENLVERVLEVNREAAGPLPEDAIRASFAAAQEPAEHS